MFTETQVKVILILLDDKGHAEWELAKYLEMSDSNLNPILKSLREMGIIFRGEARKSSKKHRREGDYVEVPYYLTRSLDALRTIIRELPESRKSYEKVFVLQIIRESNYLNAMRETFGEDVSRIMEAELRASYPPCTDPFIVDVIKPPLTKILYCRPGPEGLELWYFNYKKSILDERRRDWSEEMVKK